jgi:hypothetical protein
MKNAQLTEINEIAMTHNYSSQLEALRSVDDLLDYWHDCRGELDSAAHDLARGCVAGGDVTWLVDQYRAAQANEREAYGVLSNARLAVFKQ